MGESLTKQKPQFRLKHSRLPAVSALNELRDTQERVAVLLRENGGLGRAVNMSKKKTQTTSPVLFKTRRLSHMVSICISAGELICAF